MEIEITGIGDIARWLPMV